MGSLDRVPAPFQEVPDLPPRELSEPQCHGHPAHRGHDLGNHTVAWHLVVILLLRWGGCRWRPRASCCPDPSSLPQHPDLQTALAGSSLCPACQAAGTAWAGPHGGITLPSGGGGGEQQKNNGEREKGSTIKILVYE